jgi:hypothetical protein
MIRQPQNLRYKKNNKGAKANASQLSNFFMGEGVVSMTNMYPDFSSLTTKELLAITLRESTSEAVDELCQHFSLKELTEATVSEVSALKGMGKKKTLCSWHQLN